jgi:preprotein translocase subunit SecB
MADKKGKDKAKAESGDEQKFKPQEGSGLPVTILAQYVRDLSFENPNTPESLRAGQGAPEMNIHIGMDARKLEDPNIPNLYEVVLSARAEAARKDAPVFIAEIIYGITVSINEKVPEENHHPLLLIEIPHQAFPHVRQILSDLTMQGGYPPLLLNPVDFHGLYLSRFGPEARKKAEDAKAAVEA